jgi:hypothetical protein
MGARKDNEVKNKQLPCKSCNILFQSSLLHSMMYFQLTQIQIKVAIGPKYSPSSLDAGANIAQPDCLRWLKMGFEFSQAHNSDREFSVHIEKFMHDQMRTHRQQKTTKL